MFSRFLPLSLPQPFLALFPSNCNGHIYRPPFESGGGGESEWGEGERVSGVIESVAQWPYNNNNLLRIAPFFASRRLNGH